MTSGNVFRANRYQPTKRTYRNCTVCGEPTWSKRGLCSMCSGRGPFRPTGYTTIKAEETRKKERRLYHKQLRLEKKRNDKWLRDEPIRKKAEGIKARLETTNDTLKVIGRDFGVSFQAVHRILKGELHAKYTGGPLKRLAKNRSNGNE